MQASRVYTFIIAAMAAIAQFVAVVPALAQVSQKPLRIIVPYPPGGNTNVIARLIAQKFTEVTGQQIVIDNFGGGNGIIGTEVVVRAAPDGHTLLLGTSSLASNGSLYAKMPYDASRDLTPVMLVANTPYFVVVNAALPAQSVRDLIALAKAKPGEIYFGSAGNGSGSHLAGELFNVETGVRMVHVPYKGTAPAVTDLLGGRLQIKFVGLPAVIQHVKSGKLRLLAVCDPTRSSLMPELPTVAEAGLPGFQFAAWFGMLGPAGMAPELRNRVAADLAKVMQAKDLQERLAALGAVSLWGTPDQFEKYFRDEVARYAKIIKAANVRLD